MEFFYQSQRWKKKRKRILKRDKYQCQICNRYGIIREAVTVHHIKELETNPELAMVDGNLISVCQACHNKLHPGKGGAHK